MLNQHDKLSTRRHEPIGTDLQQHAAASTYRVVSVAFRSVMCIMPCLMNQRHSIGDRQHRELKHYRSTCGFQTERQVVMPWS